jgi:hypothetical protein
LQIRLGNIKNFYYKHILIKINKQIKIKMEDRGYGSSGKVPA